MGVHYCWSQQLFERGENTIPKSKIYSREADHIRDGHHVASGADLVKCSIIGFEHRHHNLPRLFVSDRNALVHAKLSGWTAFGNGFSDVLVAAHESGGKSLL